MKIKIECNAKEIAEALRELQRFEKNAITINPGVVVRAMRDISAEDLKQSHS